jgi:hypothetical protein
VRCKYLVGADGGASVVRKHLEKTEGLVYEGHHEKCAGFRIGEFRCSCSKLHSFAWLHLTVALVSGHAAYQLGLAVALSGTLQDIANNQIGCPFA